MTLFNPPDIAHTQRHIDARKSGRIRLIIILGALSAFGPLSTDMYLPSLPSLSHDFGTGATQAQLTLSTCFLGLAIGQIIAGPLSDALGRYRPLLVGLAAFALTSFLCTVAPAEAKDKHLDGLLGVVLEPLPDQQQKLFHVLTVVYYRNWAGPVYFNVIRPFHHLVVGSMAIAGVSRRFATFKKSRET